MSKILKNITNQSISIMDTGVTINANSSLTINHQDYLLWAASENAIPLITDGTIIVNNGTVDLAYLEGIRYLQYPDRLIIKENGTDINRVSTAIDFTGNVTITDNGNGKTTVNILNSTTLEPSLREVTMVDYSFGPINTSSDLLFEADAVNDIVKFLKEEIQ